MRCKGSSGLPHNHRVDLIRGHFEKIPMYPFLKVVATMAVCQYPALVLQNYMICDVLPKKGHNVGTPFQLRDFGQDSAKHASGFIILLGAPRNISFTNPGASSYTADFRGPGSMVRGFPETKMTCIFFV